MICTFNSEKNRDSDIDFILKSLTTLSDGFKYVVVDCTKKNIFELQQNFFKNKYYNLFLFQYFAKGDIGNYIGEIFFYLFINNEKLEKLQIFNTNFYLSDYYKPMMYLKYSLKFKTFVLTIKSNGLGVKNLNDNIHFSIEQVRKYLKIILITNSTIYNQWGLNVFLSRKRNIFGQ